MAAKGKKTKKSLFRRINDWLHLWLGLVSGTVVFIVSITGCIYVFQQEIKDIFEPWRFVEARDTPFVPPSRILDSATVYMPGEMATGLTYSHREGAAAVGYMSFKDGKRSFTAVFLNPYTGEFLKKQQMIGEGGFDFFRFVIDGHRALWLPYEIGRPVVGIGTLVFLVLLVTGMVMWWPKSLNRSDRDKSFKVKWSASFKRLNYDLHNVLGFYSLVFAFIIGVTGLVWSFTWFDNALYFLASGGEKKADHHHPHSDISNKGFERDDDVPPLDRAWYLTLEKGEEVEGMYMTPYPSDDDDPIEILIYHDRGNYYNQSEYFYDRYTLAPLEMKGSKFAEADFAEKLSMMNYDIHVGSVLGMPGKVLAFLISLVCASLPVTGFLVWWNKKKTPSRGKVRTAGRKIRPSPVFRSRGG